MPRYKDQAICLRLIDWSETSQIVAMLAREHGKFRGVAKGAKRLSPGAIGRFSGGIELFAGGQIVANVKRTAELGQITEWDLQQPRYHLRTHLRAQRLAFYAVDVTNAMLADLDPQPRVFDCLDHLLESLIDPGAGLAALLRFQWTLVVDAGYQPRLDIDVHTGHPLEESTLWFDAIGGGLTCRTGGGESPVNRWRIRPATVALLRQLAAGDCEGGSRAPDSAAPAPPSSASEAPRPAPAGDLKTIHRANRLLCAYLRALLGRELATMQFIDEA